MTFPLKDMKKKFASIIEQYFREQSWSVATFFRTAPRTLLDQAKKSSAREFYVEVLGGVLIPSEAPILTPPSTLVRSVSRHSGVSALTVPSARESAIAAFASPAPITGSPRDQSYLSSNFMIGFFDQQVFAERSKVKAMREGVRKQFSVTIPAGRYDGILYGFHTSSNFMHNFMCKLAPKLPSSVDLENLDAIEGYKRKYLELIKIIVMYLCAFTYDRGLDRFTSIHSIPGNFYLNSGYHTTTDKIKKSVGNGLYNYLFTLVQCFPDLSIKQLPIYLYLINELLNRMTGVSEEYKTQLIEIGVWCKSNGLYNRPSTPTTEKPGSQSATESQDAADLVREAASAAPGLPDDSRINCELPDATLGVIEPDDTDETEGSADPDDLKANLELEQALEPDLLTGDDTSSVPSTPVPSTPYAVVKPTP